jgi:hypothetical protein
MYDACCEPRTMHDILSAVNDLKMYLASHSLQIDDSSRWQTLPILTTERAPDFALRVASESKCHNSCVLCLFLIADRPACSPTARLNKRGCQHIKQLGMLADLPAIAQAASVEAQAACCCLPSPAVPATWFEPLAATQSSDIHARSTFIVESGHHVSN